MAKLPEPGDSIDFAQIVLEPIKVAARTSLSPQMAHDLDVRAFQDVASFMSDRLIVELRTHVYGMKVDVDEQTVPFERVVSIDEKRNVTFKPQRWTLAPFIVSVPIAVALATTSPSLWTIVLAAACCVGLILASAAMRPTTIEARFAKDVEVRGEVTMRADYWKTFPDNEMVFPKHLGQPRPAIIPQAPTTIFYDLPPDNREDS